MREILFRIYDNELKFWCEPSVYFVCADGSVWFNNCAGGEDDMVEQTDKLTVCQYTGLKDRNGKKIFEGDIVYWPEYAKPGEENFVVQWDNDNARFICLDDEASDFDFFSGLDEFYPDSECEIIGNIHDEVEK